MFQAARRLSCTVSRRASSVYHFFHYKEEFRTAKISTLVIVIAFVCWTPFFTNIAILASSITNRYVLIYLVHCAANLLTLIFAALSPYVYVFRSEKVKNCLRQLMAEWCENGAECCRFVRIKVLGKWKIKENKESKVEDQENSKISKKDVLVVQEDVKDAATTCKAIQIQDQNSLFIARHQRSRSNSTELLAPPNPKNLVLKASRSFDSQSQDGANT